MSAHNNKLVVRCCHTGMFVQALVINLTPLLFIPLKNQMGLSFEQVGRLILINFLTQMTVDLVCCALADRVKAKGLIVLANLLAGVGLWIFALSPAWFRDPYDGLVFGTVVFSTGCGLLEVLLSPIINAIPSSRKAGDMALLHALYPVGKVAVILVSGLALHLFGTGQWRWLALGWSVVPLINTVNFMRVSLPAFSEEGRRQTLRGLVRVPAYLILLLAMGFAGASEVTLAQWTSAFVEKGLGYPKVVADLVGFSLFGIGMIVGRLWFGFKGEAANLHRLMISGSLLSAAMCGVMSLAPWPFVSLVACAVAGFSVSLLWPGSVSLSAGRFPLAGASMFALLAAAGDTGAGIAPWLMGVIADHVRVIPGWLETLTCGSLSVEQLGLRTGILLTTGYPLVMAFLIRCLRNQK